MPARKAKAPVSGQLTAFQHLTEQLKWVDLVIEVADARLPESSRHPQADRLFAGKPRLVVFAKEDLADPERTGAFLKREASQPQRQALALALKTGRGRERLLAAALRLTEDRRERLAAKGLLPRPVRACVVGLPNVGKSSLINWLIGRKKAPVGDRPGVTRGAHWVRLHPAIELLDTPGILPPTSFEPGTATKLAFLNLVPEASYDAEEIARLGADLLCRLYPQCLQSYGISLDPAEDPLAQIAKARRWLTAGGNPDVRRAGQVFLHDVRAGAIGRLTLD